MENRKNVIIAIALSLIIMVGWEYLFNLPQQRAAQLAAQQQAAQQQATAPATTGTTTGTTTNGSTAPQPQAAPAGETPTTLKSRAEALAASPRVAIDTPRLKGSLALVGGRIDDLVLKDYRDTVDADSPLVTLLSPYGSAHAYYVDLGWSSADPKLRLPNYQTAWQADGTTLSPGHDVTLTWDNGQGLVFKRVYAIDENYMFTVAQSVDNAGAAAVELAPYSRVVRFGLPTDTIASATMLFEGMVGSLEGSLKENTYKDARSRAAEAEGERLYRYDSAGGWVGITDKYWLVAQVVPAEQKAAARFFYDPQLDSYQADFTAGVQQIAPGASGSFTNKVFAGAKEVHLLTAYRDQFGITNFERAIDFGYFFFLSKPLFYLLDWIYRLIGNFGVSILCLTVLVKAALFPLANKSYVSMSKMKALQPHMATLKERFGDDKQRFNQEVMALYKREKVNPAAGCLPIFVQIPVFYALYKVLSVTIEMRHAPFFGWIHDLSAQDPTSILNLFGLLPFPVDQIHTLPIIGGVLAFLSIGVWPLVMGTTMWVQQRLNPTPPDPVQARIMGLMPIMFTFMLAHNTVGLVIYWAWNNTLSILQQRYIMWKLEKANQLKKA